MAVLKKIFSSLRKLFGQKLSGGKRKKQRRKEKRKVRRKILLRVRRKPLAKPRAARPPRKKIKKKQNVPSLKRPSRPHAPATAGKLPSGKTQPLGHPVGEITHYFSKIQVVVIKITKGNLAVGNKVRIYGKSTDFTQAIRSMQIESVDVRSARRGQLIGLKVEREAKVGDKLYKLV